MVMAVPTRRVTSLSSVPYPLALLRGITTGGQIDAIQDAIHPDRDPEQKEMWLKMNSEINDHIEALVGCVKWVAGRGGGRLGQFDWRACGCS